MTPCHGIYADVNHEEGVQFLHVDNLIYRQALSEYESYKRGWEDDVIYPLQIKGDKVARSEYHSYLCLSRV